MADGKIVNMRGASVEALINSEPNPEAITYCEKLLEQARSGKLVWVASAALSCDGFFNAGWMPRTDGTLQAVGAISTLLFDFQANWQRNSE